MFPHICRQLRAPWSGRAHACRLRHGENRLMLPSTNPKPSNPPEMLSPA